MKTMSVLPVATEKLLKTLRSERWISRFYLAGGTALAIHYGHRQSVDLDWFTARPINAPTLLAQIAKAGMFELLNEGADTVEGILNGVKVSFITYPYPLLEKTVTYGGFVRLAQPLDIALMKLGAIAGRNTKKDFIDLYVFLTENRISLTQLLDTLDTKFKKIRYDRYHLYKALLYFTEADRDPDPMLVRPIRWSAVKLFFRQEVKKIVG